MLPFALAESSLPAPEFGSLVSGDSAGLQKPPVRRATRCFGARTQLGDHGASLLDFALDTSSVV